MQSIRKAPGYDLPLILVILFLVIFSLVTLYSIAPFLFPLYYLYIILGITSYILFSNIDFETLSVFSKHFYIICIIFLLLPLLLGQVVRGAVRWIPIGDLTIQPTELVRPFLIVFFAKYFTWVKLDLKGVMTSLILLAIPVILILIQPSLGVAVLTIIAYFGVLISTGINKKYIIFGVILGMISLPILFKSLAPYQQSRVLTFINPQSDPLGAGYNSIQSMISVGSGKIIGRGLGRGVQTQLAFLPERHTDFIFASISEELGLVGGLIILSAIFFILIRITRYMERSSSPAARAFLSGVFFSLFFQTIINIGMNLGLIPITGLPLPLVSAGGSSFLATMTMLGMAVGARKYL